MAAKESLATKQQWEVEHATKEAVSTIQATVKEAIGGFAAAAKDAVSAISQAAQAARNDVASQAADAAKVLVAKQADGGSDHDTLVTLVAKVDNLGKNVADGFGTMRSEIKEVGSSVAVRMSDLEHNKLDSDQSYCTLYKKDVDEKLAALRVDVIGLCTSMTRILAIGSAAIVVVGIVVPVILHFWK